MAELLNVFEQTKQFENSLPIPKRIDATQGGNYTVVMQATEKFLGLYESNTDSQLQTTVWGYGLEGETVTYPGPTFVAQSGEKIKVEWVNDLPLTGYFNDDSSYFLPIDLTLHRADPKKRLIEEGYVPTVAHLHGGHTQAKYDGYPEAWFVQKTKEKGKAYDGNNYTYDNDQRAATLWYHDHALGVTRLNVYAGLAGFYLLRDDTENALIADGTLPSGDYEIELAIQDRAFTADGQLFLPANSQDQIALYGEEAFPNTDLYELTETVVVEGENYVPGTIVFRDTEDGNYYLEGETYDNKVLFEDFDPNNSSLSTQVPSAMAEFFGNVNVVNGMA